MNSQARLRSYAHQSRCVLKTKQSSFLEFRLRYSVALDTPRLAATSFGAMPLASRCLADFSFDSSIFGLRPPRRPRARAAVNPAIVRSRTSSRSIWAKAAMT